LDAGTPEGRAETNRIIWGEGAPSHFPWENIMSQAAREPEVASNDAPPQTPKTDERTGNVYENKRAAARAQAKSPQACPSREGNKAVAVI